LGAEDTDHDRFFGLLFNGTTQDRSIPFVENLDDLVIIDRLSALGDFGATGRAGIDIFGQYLFTTLA
jgi:hypothetical protein